ncbi:MAG: GNAT family N-acetyltransferase [Ignavibacteria bacterium]|nr:GNAT family N-acetyltransferase [Ignavibacteria bacterium]
MSIELHSNRLVLKELRAGDAEIFSDFLLRNKEFFRFSGPVYEKEYDSLEYHRRMLERSQTESLDGRHYKFGVYKNEDRSRIIGSVALSNIAMGNFRSCFLGYRIDERENSKGYATEAIKRVIEFAFLNLKLHRIEANIMPRNKTSIRVVENLGFTFEGESKKYLQINGVWEDHMHFVLLNRDIE